MSCQHFTVKERHTLMHLLCLIPGRVSIHDRPADVEGRRRFGCWESDSVEGEKGSGGIATHVERKSRLLVAARLDNKQADTFSEATIIAFTAIPKAWRKTFTVDNGKEFAAFKTMERATGMDVYFADPYCLGNEELMKIRTGC